MLFEIDGSFPDDKGKQKRTSVALGMKLVHKLFISVAYYFYASQIKAIDESLWLGKPDTAVA